MCSSGHIVQIYRNFFSENRRKEYKIVWRNDGFLKRTLSLGKFKTVSQLSVWNYRKTIPQLYQNETKKLREGNVNRNHVNMFETDAGFQRTMVCSSQDSLTQEFFGIFLWPYCTHGKPQHTKSLKEICLLTLGPGI